VEGTARWSFRTAVSIPFPSQAATTKCAVTKSKNSKPSSSSHDRQRPFIPSWLDDAGLSPAEMRVFVHLVRSSDNQTGVAWPSYGRMTSITAMGKSTVRRCLEELERRSLIAKVGKPFGGSCRYRVLPIVPPEGQMDTSNGSTTGAIEPAPIVPPQDRNSPPDGTLIVPPEGHEGNPKKVLHRRKSNIEPSPELPFSSEAFAGAWEDWQQHRREKKKPLTPTSAKSQFKAFLEWGEARSIMAIEHSIRNGWQGVFEPTVPTSKPNATVNTGRRTSTIEEQ
jgi:hypothetical protein